MHNMKRRFPLKPTITFLVIGTED